MLTRDTSFTLVLGGGGMKGLSHVGVLEALVEHGLRPERIVGSSIGALVGAAWASGIGVARLRELALAVQRRDIFRVAHTDMAFKRMLSPALFRREPLEDLIRGIIGDVRFGQLDPPVVVNTVDVNSGMQVFWGLPGLDDVPVRDAVFASCALPGYLPPREIRGRFYVDGAAVDNLPVGVSRAFGSELVIAVDISASSALREDTQEEGFARVFARATEIAMNTLLEQRLKRWTVPPLFYIHPRVEHIGLFSFDRLRELVEEGYRATSAALETPQEWPPAGASGVYPRRRVIVGVQRERCIGCGACLVHAPPGMFTIDGEGKAAVTQPEQEWDPADGGFIRHCPTYAITARPHSPAPGDGQRRSAVHRT